MRKGRVLAVAALLVSVAAIAAAIVAAVHRTRHTPSSSPPPPHRPAPRPPVHPKIVSGRHDAPVPILMYHVISAAPASAPYPDLYVSPTNFAGQMDWLVRRGYHAVTLRRVYDYWRKGYALPRRPIVLSFDDGYLSDVTHALPVLRAHHWPAVLNLEVRHAEPNDLPVPRIKELIAAGWELDAHTITHPDLTTVDDARLWHEVDGSRKLIRRMFRVPADFFCYPSGRYDARVLRAVRLAGYLGATTTNYGLANPSAMYTLARVRINGSDGVRGFASKLQSLTSSPY